MKQGKNAPQFKFKEIAELAAKAEREGEYNRAMAFWEKAEQLAKKMANKEWCKNRAAFLKTWEIRLLKARNKD